MLTDQVDEWATTDPEDTVAYGQPPVVHESKSDDNPSPDYQ